MSKRYKRHKDCAVCGYSCDSDKGMFCNHPNADRGQVVWSDCCQLFEHYRGRLKKLAELGLRE